MINGEPPTAEDQDPATNIESPSPAPASAGSKSGGRAGKGKPLFSFVCPHADCQERNFVFDEADNICFNCQRELWLGREAREARWYEEAGRKQFHSGGDLELVGLGLCPVALLGVPMLIRGNIERKHGRMLQERGEDMNRKAGRPNLARSTRHFGGLSGGEYRTKRGPDEADAPDGLETDLSAWIKVFARIYYSLWVVGVIAALVILSSLVHSHR